MPDRRPRPAPPSGISAEAQRFLEVDLLTDGPAPALDDTAAWLAQVEVVDAFIADRFGSLDLPVRTTHQPVGGVPTFVLRSDEADDAGPVYLDLHGGALLYGGGDVCGLMAGVTAVTSGMVTCAPDYRMPPDHPYPAALDDCFSVYRALLADHDPAHLVVGGESAGGNLAAALVARADAEGLPLPAALVLLSPELDLTESGDSFRTNAGIDNVLGSLMPVNRLYAAGHDLDHPYLSPLFAEVARFPPTFLTAGTRDLFLSNAVRMHRKLRAAGVEAELHVFEAMPHGGFGGAPEDADLRREDAPLPRPPRPMMAAAGRPEADHRHERRARRCQVPSGRSPRPTSS